MAASSSRHLSCVGPLRAALTGLVCFLAICGDVRPALAATPLPDHPSLFGDAIVAMYIFRAPYLTTVGDPPRITSVVNAHAPGTHDVTFAVPPLFIETCGVDADGVTYGCARFDGLDDYGEADGFAMVTGDRPSLIAVMQMNDVSDVTAIPFQLTNDAGSQFMNLPEVRTQGENLWRYNGSFTSPPHNIDFGTPDLALHLHEQHLASPETLAIFDGEIQADRGGDSGVTGPITKVSLGRRAPFEYASVDIFEALVVDRPTLEQAERYRRDRIRLEYPTIPLPSTVTLPALHSVLLRCALCLALTAPALRYARRARRARS